MVPLDVVRRRGPAIPASRRRINVTRLNKIRMLIAVAGILVVGLALSVQSRHRNLEHYRENIGTVTTIDTAARQAGLEIIHPRTGQKLSLTGKLPDECPITIDGAPASFNDIRVGDRVLLKRRGMNILAVDVQRAGVAAGSVAADAASTAPEATASAPHTE